MREPKPLKYTELDGLSEKQLKEHHDVLYAGYVKKVNEIEEKLKNYVLIDESTIDTSRVNVGCTVTLFDEEFEEEVSYKIMGSTESDPVNGFISNQSPIGKALLGRKKGETVDVETPGGIVKFKVLKISA